MSEKDGVQIKGADGIRKGQFIKKDDSIYKVIDIDNEYVQSKFILEDINTHEEKSFYFIDLIGAYKIEFGEL